MLKKMNLPNKLTLLRMILVPIFIIFMALPTEWIWPLYVALAIFIIAAITDRLDGHIARKNNIVTNFGKIMDPLADKLLVASGFIMLVGLDVLPAWIIAVIIVRDFFVNGLRMFGADNNKDLAAGISGKIKTVFQMIAIPLAILGVALDSKKCAFGIFLSGSMTMSILELFVNILMTVSMAAVLISTVWSFVDYLIRFKDDLEENLYDENESEDENLDSEEIVEENSDDNDNNDDETTLDENNEEKEEAKVEDKENK
jgi:CDP-diacylglycerol--glycerol-3-phosphate 3-phosphatidyltransferase